jgi:hypothetical protein
MKIANHKQQAIESHKQGERIFFSPICKVQSSTQSKHVSLFGQKLTPAEHLLSFK